MAQVYDKPWIYADKRSGRPRHHVELWLAQTERLKKCEGPGRSQHQRGDMCTLCVTCTVDCISKISNSTVGKCVRLQVKAQEIER
jgi:hypothetical protein